ncbi:AIPR family protein [Treponema endosymbiont of Eucomonympha sp.]|uniref:AIPR family protein n=1 Tax=Treponema endosymbiont of Eucomonympha sp. TaxID=1580831 RepID=UPI000A5FA338|nr:AIPR family protein [Treponema endosymbiont of Eucomonympha sp.]
MDPILKRYFNNFLESFELPISGATEDESKKLESTYFEKFINYTIFSLDCPEIFTGNTDLLDYVCIGGESDTGLDGIGIRINDTIVDSKDSILDLTEQSKKLMTDYVFIQAKMSPNFDLGEFSKFSLGIKNFFSEGYLPENKHIKEIRGLKDFIYDEKNEKIISKLDAAPSIYIYYITTGADNSEDQNFLGAKKSLIEDLKKTSMYFNNILVNYIGGKQLVKYCRELENKFEVFLNVKDIFPLTVQLENNEDIKKAYTFTCDAKEFLKILTKEDGQLRRSLFYSNVRDYLGRKGSVNSEIEETIRKDPELFLLCNNGITIVCSDFDQIKDRLIQIENPQIVNGCQTSNTIFNMHKDININKVQLLIRVISTENITISNKIVRGTNKQNQVLDEAFETTRAYHQDILEPFFLSFNCELAKLYYERRAKQYNYETSIKKTQIVNFRILIQTFVAVFLKSPHESHFHEAKLLEKYGGDSNYRTTFIDTHKPQIYYLVAVIWYMFEKCFRDKLINNKYKTYKFHLYYTFCGLFGESPSNLCSEKNVKRYYNEIISNLKPECLKKNIDSVISLFDSAQKKWQEKGGSHDGIKDNQKFTSLLTELIENETKKKIVEKQENLPNDEKNVYSGRILNIIQRPYKWFGFIDRGQLNDNIYFDATGFNGSINLLHINQLVQYEIGYNTVGEMATNIKL